MALVFVMERTWGSKAQLGVEGDTEAINSPVYFDTANRRHVELTAGSVMFVASAEGDDFIIPMLNWKKLRLVQDWKSNRQPDSTGAVKGSREVRER